MLKAVERGGVPLITRDGIYAKLGSLTTGSGFAFGVGYRTRRFLEPRRRLRRLGGRVADRLLGTRGAAADAGARRRAASVLNALRAPSRLSAGRLLRSRPRLAAGDSQPTSACADTTVGARAGGRVAGPLSPIGGGVEYIRAARRRRQGHGAAVDRRRCSTTRRRPASTRSPTSCARRRSSRWTTASRSTRARAAGIAPSFSHYDDRDCDALLLQPPRRRSAAVRQLPRRSGACSWAARSSRPPTPTTGQTMPFYLMPTLGGNDTLRGFRDYRFRGPHALLLQARVSLRDLVGPRRGAVLRRRQGGAAPRRSRLQRPRVATRLRVPLQHRQRHRPPRRRRVRQPRWQASLHRLRRHVLDAARRACAPCVGARCVAVVGAVAARASPRRASIPTIRCGSTTTRRSTRRSVAPVEDANGYDFVVNTFVTPGERRDVRAMNVNTSTRCPTRAGSPTASAARAMSIAEIVRGPDRVDVDLARRLGGVAAARPPACSPASG